MPGTSMSPGSSAPQALCLDLVQWVAERPRDPAEVMDAWRTSCPRLTVWEDVVDAGWVRRHRDAAGRSWVTVTDAGRRFLADHGREGAAARPDAARG